MLKHSIDNWMDIIKIVNPPAQRMFEQWYGSPAYIENTKIREQARTILEKWSNTEGSFTPHKEDYEKDKWDRFFIHIDIHNSGVGQRKEEDGNVRTGRFVDHPYISAAYRTITFMDDIGGALKWQVQTVFTPQMDANHQAALRDLTEDTNVRRHGWPDNDYDNELGIANEVRRGKFDIRGAQYLSLQIRGIVVNESFKRPVYLCTGWHDMMTIGEQGAFSDYAGDMCNSSFIAISESGAKTANQSEGVNICLSPASTDITNGDMMAVSIMTFASCRPLDFGSADFGAYPYITNILGGTDERMVEAYLDHVNEQQTTSDGLIQHDTISEYVYGVLNKKFEDNSPYNEILRPAGYPIARPALSGMRSQLFGIMTVYENRSYDCFLNQWKKFGIVWEEEDNETFKVVIWILNNWPDNQYGDGPGMQYASDIRPNEVHTVFSGRPSQYMSEEDYNRLIEIHNELSCNERFNAPPYEDSEEDRHWQERAGNVQAHNEYAAATEA